MSNTSTQSLSFVRKNMLDERDPPLGEKGMVKWARENLFSSWLNAILTVLSIVIIAYVIWSLSSWLLNSVWNARTLTECREVIAANTTHPGTEGACWAVIRDRWFQLMFGFYPPAYVWRPLLALILLFVSILPILFPERISKIFFIVTAFYPFIMPWLLWGGAIWTPLLVMAGFVVGYIVLRIITGRFGSLAGTIAAILAAALWWMYALPVISDTLYRTVAESRMETAKVEYAATAAELPEVIDAFKAEQEALGEQMAEISAEKNDLIDRITQERFRRQISPVLPSVEGALNLNDSDLSVAGVERAYRQVRHLLSEFNMQHGGAELGRYVGDLNSLVRLGVPQPDEPIAEGAEPVVTDEMRAGLEELRQLTASAIAVTDDNAMTDEVLDQSVEQFMGHMRTLTGLSEQSLQLGSDIKATDDIRRNASDLVRNINRLETNQARLPELRESALTLRAELPETVTALKTVPSDTAILNEIPREDIQALRSVLSVEQDVVSADRAVTSTFRDVGRIGLYPVESRQFGGFQLAFVIGVVGILASLPIGILLALGRQSDLFIINKSAVAFIEIIRGVPLIVWLLTAQFLLNYFLPPESNFDLVLRVIIMVTLFASAYIAEVVRGGLAALPKGQYEAADALGMDYWKAMRLIVLPQALKISIPGIVNTFIGLFKDTVLVVFIGLLDPLGLAGTARASTEWNGIYWELFIFIGAVFFIICFSMGRYSLFLENKLQREHR